MLGLAAEGRRRAPHDVRDAREARRVHQPPGPELRGAAPLRGRETGEDPPGAAAAQHGREREPAEERAAAAAAPAAARRPSASSAVAAA